MKQTLFGDGNVDTVEELQENWRDPYLQWWAAGMPSYDQQAMEPWKQITIKFRTKEDRQYFSDLLEFGLTDKTFATWYPKKDRDPNMMSRYVEQGIAQDMFNSVEENIEEDDDTEEQFNE